MTSLTCTSRQARTHRLHWMQASRLTRIAGWLASLCQRSAAGKRLSTTPDLSAQCQNFESGSCEVARSGWSATSSSITIFCAAIAVRPVIRRRRIAQMRDLGTVPPGHLPDRLAGPCLDQLAIEFELDLLHSAASLNSSGKYLITEVSGFAAAWPSPQIDASRITWLNSSSNCAFQTARSIKTTAFCVPTRHGV